MRAGFIMYKFFSKFVCLYTPVKVTGKNKDVKLLCNLSISCTLECFIIMAQNLSHNRLLTNSLAFWMKLSNFWLWLFIKIENTYNLVRDWALVGNLGGREPRMWAPYKAGRWGGWKYKEVEGWEHRRLGA